jgi:hypothetical protein
MTRKNQPEFDTRIDSWADFVQTGSSVDRWFSFGVFGVFRG